MGTSKGLVDEHRSFVVIVNIEGDEVDILSTVDLSRLRVIIVETHPHIVGKEKIPILVKNIETKGFHLPGVYHKTCFFQNTK